MSIGFLCVMVLSRIYGFNEAEEKYDNTEDRQEVRNKSKEGGMRLINYETKKTIFAMEYVMR